jgi:hypothetical protein
MEGWMYYSRIKKRVKYRERTFGKPLIYSTIWFIAILSPFLANKIQFTLKTVVSLLFDIHTNLALISRLYIYPPVSHETIQEKSRSSS